MDFNTINVPLRVLISVTGLSLTRWLDLINLRHACGDEAIYTVLDQACKKLGLLPPARTLSKIPFSFFVEDEQKLLVAKIKYNF
jgi:hypothetical protein